MEPEDVDDHRYAVGATPASDLLGQVLDGAQLQRWGALPSAAMPTYEAAALFVLGKTGQREGNRYQGVCATPGCKNVQKIKRTGLCHGCNGYHQNRSKSNSYTNTCRDDIHKEEAIAQLCTEEGIEAAPLDFADANEKQRYVKWNRQEHQAQVFIKRVAEYKRACTVRGCVRSARSVRVGYCNMHQRKTKPSVAA